MMLHTDEIIDKDEVLKMARHIASTFGTRMCDENGDTHGEELYAMNLDDIVDTIKLVAMRTLEGTYDEMIAIVREQEREACAKLCEEFADYDSDENGVNTDYHAYIIRARGRNES